jgi:hypothetical protein
MVVDARSACNPVEPVEHGRRAATLEDVHPVRRDLQIDLGVGSATDERFRALAG